VLGLFSVRYLRLQFSRATGAALMLALVGLFIPSRPAAATPLACTPTSPGFDAPGAQVNVGIAQTSAVSRLCDSVAISTSVSSSSSFAQAAASLTPWTLGAWANGVNHGTSAEALFLDVLTVGGGPALPAGCPGGPGCPVADSGAILTFTLSGYTTGDGYVDAIVGLRQSGSIFTSRELTAAGETTLNLPFGTYSLFAQLVAGNNANGAADFMDTLSFSLGPLPSGVTVQAMNGFVVPEPGTPTLLSLGLAVLAASRPGRLAGVHGRKRSPEIP